MNTSSFIKLRSPLNILFVEISSFHKQQPDSLQFQSLSERYYGRENTFPILSFNILYQPYVRCCAISIRENTLRPLYPSFIFHLLIDHPRFEKWTERSFEFSVGQVARLVELTSFSGNLRKDFVRSVHLFRQIGRFISSPGPCTSGCYVDRGTRICNDQNQEQDQDQDQDDGERLAAEFHEETLISYEFRESLSSRGASPYHLPGGNSDGTEKFRRARAYI